ncbi:MAG TPA: intradiol ring-cleavage dioxygenase [bacterium]|nr:intradiol ring-cleavage dioxygenase [bacterium]
MRWAAGVTAALALVAAGCGGRGTSSAPTPSGSSTTRTARAATTGCVPGRLTPEQTEGPFFKAGSPERERVDQGATGQALVLTGQVLSQRCRPVGHARMEFWQADGRGSYDNSGYRLRGHEFTDAQGRYRLVTVYPGLYTGRTRHIHVKVQPPGGRALTTQLYFPGEPRNASDGIFTPDAVVALTRGRPAWTARFDFVVRA